MSGKASSLSGLHKPTHHHENTLKYSSHRAPLCSLLQAFQPAWPWELVSFTWKLFVVPRHNLFLLYGETKNAAFLVCRLITLLATEANNSNHLITGMLWPRINLLPAYQIKKKLWFGKHTFDSKYTCVLFICLCMDFKWIWKEKNCIPSGFHNEHSML